MRRFCLLIILSLAAASVCASSGDILAQSKEYISQNPRDTSLVIYQDLALVTEQRSLTLAQGANTVKFRGIPDKILLDSIQPACSDPSLLSYLDQEYIPSGAGAKPELVWQLTAKQALSPAVELSYLTKGLSWQVDYVATLGGTGRTLDLAGWIRITNASGGDFSLARIKLAADRLTYDLPGRLTLSDGETKSLLFVNATGIPVNRAYITEHVEEKPAAGTSPGGISTAQRVKVLMTFTNTRDISGGMSLLAGNVRIYRAEQNSFKTLVGGDVLSYIPLGGLVQLRVGDDPDITVERTVTDYKEISSKLYETSYSLRIRNRKPDEVELMVIERFPGSWVMLASTAAGMWQKTDERTASCRIKIPGDGTADILYRVKVSLP